MINRRRRIRQLNLLSTKWTTYFPPNCCTFTLPQFLFPFLILLPLICNIHHSTPQNPFLKFLNYPHLLPRSNLTISFIDPDSYSLPKMLKLFKQLRCFSPLAPFTLAQLSCPPQNPIKASVKCILFLPSPNCKRF